MLYQAPLHKRHKMLSAMLSGSLKEKYGVNSVPIRSGDTVRILRGDFKGLEGKVTRVDRKNYRIFIEGITREKVDGTTIFVPIHPSKVMITNMNLDDKWRRRILERKGAVAEKPEEEVEKAEERETRPGSKKEGERAWERRVEAGI